MIGNPQTKKGNGKLLITAIMAHNRINETNSQTKRKEAYMEIKVINDPPRDLISAANEFKSDYPTIKEIFFGANVINAQSPILGNVIAGAYHYEEGIILVDLQKCVELNKFKSMGISLIPSFWMATLWTLYHEVGHALQLERDPSLIKLETLPKNYEDEADDFAKEMVYEWTSTHPIPKLEDMGWMKTKMKEAINHFFGTKMGDALMKEYQASEKGGAAEVELFIELNDIKREPLIASVDEGKIGLIINGQRYLTAMECVDSMMEGTVTGTTPGAQDRRLISYEPKYQDTNVNQDDALDSFTANV